MAAKAGVQIYGPTSGVFSGWLGMITCAVISGIALFDYRGVQSFRWLVGALAAAVVFWAVMLRPRIIVRTPDTLELRNPLSAWLVPLASINIVAIRAIARVEADGRTYDCVAVGRRIRKMRRPASAQRSGAGTSGLAAFGGVRQGYGERFEAPPKKYDFSTPEAIADLVTDQVLNAAASARAAGQAQGPAKRVWAVPELVLLGVLLVVLAVSYL